MPDVETGIVAISGHRVYPDRAALYRGLDTMRARHYYFGGARGVDTDALEYLGKTQPGSVRTVVVPNRLIDQPVATRAITKRYASNIVELKNSGANRFMIRNRFMVDKAHKLNAFYDFRGRGGTYNTIEYAKTKGKLGVVNPLRNFNFNEFKGMSKTRFHTTIKQMKGYKMNLSSIKMIIVRMIIQVFGMTIRAFFRLFGYVGVNTVEQFWSY